MDEVTAEVVEEKLPEVMWVDRIIQWRDREGDEFVSVTYTNVDEFAKHCRNTGRAYRILRVQPPTPAKPTDRGQWDVFGAPPSETWETMRESCHATFNGGHHDPKCRDAFHHGMDTVFNCLSGGGFKDMAECKQGVPTPPKKQRVEIDWDCIRANVNTLVLTDGFKYLVEANARIVEEEVQP